MPRKASKPKLSVEDIQPQLSRFYVHAHKDVFVYEPYIPRKFWAIFRKWEGRLADEGIGLKEYAYTVIMGMKDWARNKGLQHIPIHTFCSEFAMGIYRKVANSSSVNLADQFDNERERLLYNELLVARLFIERRTKGESGVTLDSIVKELGKFLYGGWLDLYRSGKLRDCEDSALDILCDEYHLKYARDYGDIAERVKCRV